MSGALKQFEVWPPGGLMTVPRLSGAELHKQLVRRQLPPVRLAKPVCSKESHEALRARFDLLDFVGYQDNDFGDGESWLAIANTKCCGTSLCREVPPEEFAKAREWSIRHWSSRR